MTPHLSTPDLIALDALGEATPEQQERLHRLLQTNPTLAAEHAAFRKLSSVLAMNSTAIPPISAQVLDKIQATLEPQRLAVWHFIARPLAVAASIALFALGAWVLTRNDTSTSHVFSQNQPQPTTEEPAALAATPLASATLASSTGTRRALLIGIEPWPDKEKDPERGAAWRDLQMMREVLTKKWGFMDANIVQVFNKEATTQNAIRAFEILIAQAQANDPIVIYWTSHGTQVADTNGDEPDGLDEAYCTFNYDWSDPNTWFTDDLFAGLLYRLPSKNVLVITDTCHAGGSTRGAEDDLGDQPKAISSGFVPAAKANPAAIPIIPPSHVLHLAACNSDEVSYGGYGKGGYFTIQLHEVFLASPPNTTSFQQVMEKVKPKISALFKSLTPKPNSPKTWTPQYEGPVTKKIATFLDPPPAPPAPPSPPQPPLPIWQKQSGDISLKLSTDKTIYTEGDLMQVSVTPDLDCHLRLYYLSADHAVHQIFPNKFQPDGFVKKDQPISLPGATGTFEFRMSAPFGNEILMAVASSLPFTDQAGQDVQTQLFQEFKDTNLESLAQRGISVDEKKALTGRALHLYRVEARK